MNASKNPRLGRLRLIAVSSIVAALAVGAIGQAVATGLSDKAAVSTFDVPATTRSFADVVEQASPSVVTVSVTKRSTVKPAASFRQSIPPGQVSPFDEFFGRFFDMPEMAPRAEGQARALGSGFVIDEDGYIVTNNHVIEGADHITVSFSDGPDLDATLVGTDPKTDLALLKIEPGKPLPALQFGDSDSARVGDWVLAIGNPFGLGGTATAGIISARGRDIRSGPYDDYLQIDAPINSGNSGGPVFNADGEVIGVNTAIYSPNGGNVGIGFAIPSKQVQTIVAELKSTGSIQRGWLGVQIQDVDEELAQSLGLDEPTGALIAEVVKDSPADEAGFHVGDVITKFGAEEVTSAKALSLAVANASPAEKYTATILRDGHRKSIKVKLGEAEALAMNDSSDSAMPSSAGSELGLALADLSASQRERLGLPDDFDGVLVTQVDPNGPAAEQGIRPGDVIARIGQRPVGTVSDAVSALKKARSDGDYAALLVRRGDSQQFVSVAFS